MHISNVQSRSAVVGDMWIWLVAESELEIEEGKERRLVWVRLKSI